MAVAMQAAAVVDTKVAADTTKLLLLHRAAVCTTGGGAYQLRRFCFADNISDCIAPRWTSHSDRQRQGRLLRGKHRRRIEAIHIGLFSLGQIVSDSIGLDLIRADLIGADLIVFDLIRIRLDWLQVDREHIHRPFFQRERRPASKCRFSSATGPSVSGSSASGADAAALKPLQSFRNRMLRATRGALSLIVGIGRGRVEFSGLRPCSAPVLTKHSRGSGRLIRRPGVHSPS